MSKNKDIVDAVLEQHEEAKKGLRDVAAKPAAARGEAFRSLSGVLEQHEAAEEAVIYPAIRRLGNGGAKVADARTTEESIASRAINELRNMDASTAEFADAFDGFAADVLKHASKEEAEVIPLLRTSFSEEDRMAMGKAFLEAQHTN